jgi:hypothetical protein
VIFILTGGKNEALATAAEAGLKLSQWQPVGIATLRGIGSDHEIWISPCWKHRRGDSARKIESDLLGALAMGDLGPKYVQIACMETPYERPI